MMNNKFKFKMILDLTMTILLLFLMARQITGTSAHEWIGAAMFVLWITHNVLNHRWYLNLFKGRYTISRGIQTFTNMCLLLCMLGTMVSAVILSKEVFLFLPISGSASIARQLHILSVFWAFVLMLSTLDFIGIWYLG